MNKETVKEKLKQLELVKLKLKEKFIGIDTIIDNFVNSIKVWYVAPELQLRPLIVNLWGMTGVGKTDLIRTFVELIGFNDKFLEMQMDNLKPKSWLDNGTIQGKLEFTFEDQNINGILLLDEMQRFRTIDEKGLELPKDQIDKYSDIWTLLSDGKFSSDAYLKTSLNDLFYDCLIEIEREKSEKEPKKKKNKTGNGDLPEPESQKQSKYKIYYWKAKTIKQVLRCEESIEEIMLWNNNILLDRIQKVIDSKQTYVGANYSKLLIIISGNLDEAYSMAEDSDDVDIDADIYHEYSKRITLVDIKQALAQRFKPEQIARFGNTHLIYPSLDKKSYETIIKNRLQLIKEHVKNQTGITFEFDSSVCDLIYRNGVFPTQGVRPVLSTISNIIENNLPFFSYICIDNNINSCTLKYSNENLFVNIGDKTIDAKINATIDKIKKGKNEEFETLVAVHEAGHAIVYMNEFGVTPMQLVCNAASSHTKGFAMPHAFNESKNIIIKNIMVCFGGQCAEEYVFGIDHVSRGSSSDIKSATNKASDMVRRLGMDDGFIGDIITSSDPVDQHHGLIEKDISNNAIKDILLLAKNKTKSVINNNALLLRDLSMKLIEMKKMNDNDIFEVAKKYMPNIRIENASHVISEKYINQFKTFCEK